MMAGNNGQLFDPNAIKGLLNLGTRAATTPITPVQAPRQPAPRFTPGGNNFFFGTVPSFQSIQQRSPKAQDFVSAAQGVNYDQFTNKAVNRLGNLDLSVPGGREGLMSFAWRNMPQADLSKGLPNQFRFNVTDNMLASNRMVNILSKDSPYLKAAQTRALNLANARGLLNSSLAATAGTAAAVQAALPLAQQEAQTYFNAGQLNFQADANTFLNKLQFNLREQGAVGELARKIAQLDRAYQAQAKSDITKAQAQSILGQQQAETRAGLESQRGAIQSLLYGQQAAANMLTQAQRGAIQSGLDAQRYNAEAQLARQKFYNTWQLANQDARVKDALLKSEYGWRLIQDTLNVDAQSRMRAALQKLSEFSAGQRQLMAAAGNIWQSGMAGIGDILSDRTLSPEERDTRVNQSIDAMNAALDWLDSISARVQ